VVAQTAEGPTAALTLAGTGISMEGIDQNPSFYELVLDSLWSDINSSRNSSGDDGSGGNLLGSTDTDAKVDAVTDYLVDFGVRRCGKPVAAVAQAWRLLANSTFRAGSGVGLNHAYCSDANVGYYTGGWTKAKFWRGGYDSDVAAAAYAAQLFQAWVLLTESAAECGTQAIRFDIADIGREWLQTVPCVAAWRSLATAWDDRGVPPTARAAAVTQAGSALDAVVLDIDRLLSSCSGFLFGEWIQGAQALGTSKAGRDQLVNNAKIQVGQGCAATDNVA